MFFFVLTSHSVGAPYIDDTMFLSGVPPPIGQLPVPGSEASNGAPAMRTRAATA